MPPFLATMPPPHVLRAEERSGLRDLFKDYAIELLKVQKKADIRGYVEGAAIAASVVATFWNPLTWPATVFGAGIFARNLRANAAWKRRHAGLQRLSEWVQNLL